MEKLPDITLSRKKMLVTSNITNVISLDDKKVSVYVWVSRVISVGNKCYFL